MNRRVGLTVLMAAALVIGCCLFAYTRWSKWEVEEAPKLAAAVLDTFSLPCNAERVALRCDVPVSTMPRGTYSFVVVDSMPFHGVYVRARYSDGSEIALDVFPTLFSSARVHVRDVVRPASEETRVVVRILKDASRCSVQGSVVTCSEVAQHMIDVLGLNPGTPVAVTADPTAGFEHVNVVLGQLREAGFTLGAAYLLD